MAFKLSKNDGILEPEAIKIDPKTGNSMWIIDGYKIWARTYKEALELLPMIQSF
jgi:hypothetical protein